MPAIVVKEYTWRQTDDTVVINTPLFGNPKNVDLFTAKNYIKASYPPFILELFLWGIIKDEASECVLNKEQGEVVFTLRKADFGILWPSLVVEGLDRVAKKERRLQAFEQAQALTEERAKARSEKNHMLQKQAVRAQINLDTAMLNKIDMHRDTERKEAMKDFEDWRSAIETPILSNIEGKTQENRKAYRPALKWFKDDAGDLKSREMTRAEVNGQGLTIGDDIAAAAKIKCKDEDAVTMENNSPGNKSVIDEARKSESDNSSVNGIDGLIKNEYDEDTTASISSEESDIESETIKTSAQSATQIFIKEINKKRLKKFYKEKSTSNRTIISKLITPRSIKMNAIFDEPKKSVPLPRKCGVIDVKFSERRFPTPARESHQVEEQEWLEKQAEARRQTGFVVEDLRPEELDPQWLKDKGDQFFKAGNYLGAVSAYSHGMKLSPKMSSLFSNRSAAHYALGNYVKCTEDCSKALELMVPHCKGNSDSRAKCHARRGAALCKLGSPQHGIPELEAALKLDPSNMTVERDLRAARQYFNIQE